MPQPSGKIGGAGEMRGLGARLQQKERQVQQLQMELEQLKSEKSSEKQDQVCSTHSGSLTIGLGLILGRRRRNLKERESG